MTFTPFFYCPEKEERETAHGLNRNIMFSVSLRRNFWHNDLISMHAPSRLWGSCVFMCVCASQCLYVLYFYGGEFREIFRILFLSLFCFSIFDNWTLWWRRILCLLYSFKRVFKKQIMRAMKKTNHAVLFSFWSCDKLLSSCFFFFF